MALEGNLADFSLADMFRLLESGAKTGALYVGSGDDEGVVCFRDGEIFFASVGASSPLAADRLVEEGIISSKQLRQARGLMKIQKRDKAGRKLGQILVDEGYQAISTLEDFVGREVADALFDLMRRGEGELRFVAGESCPEADLGISLSVARALEHADERLATWRSVREQIPDADTRFAMSQVPGTGEQEIHLKPSEWALLCHLHGDRSVGELVEMTDLSEFDAALVLFGMYSTGLIEKVGPTGERSST